MRRAVAAVRIRAALSLLATLCPGAAAVGADGKPPGNLETLRLTVVAAPAERLLDGTVEAVNQTTASAQTAGRIVAINADVNDRISAGTVIVRIRSTEQVAGLTQAQAALKEATAREAEAQTHYERIRDMYQRRVVAKATLDEASAGRDAAVARLIAARAGLDAAQEGVSYTEIRAPYTGVVTQKLVQLGQSVAPGTPLMAGASLDELRVVAEVPQSVIEQVRKVRKAAVYVDGRRIEATGLMLYPAAQPETNSFRVRIELPKGVQGLAPGMFVKVGLVTGSADLLLAPRSAVVERSEMRAVYVVGPDGRLSLRQVRLGHARGEQIEILAGLVAGETIALDPAAAAARARQQTQKHD
jgi:RND family efflux transporter MFP subunit